jgi:hypothetical protein
MGLKASHEAQAAKRIHVIGPPGSGKTWLAERLAAERRCPVYHLDDVAHIAGGGSPLRPDAELAALVRELELKPAWVCEGVDTGWTDPIMAVADLVVWLDDAWWRRVGRMGRRFVAGGIAEARRQRGWRRFGRLRDYGSRLGQLGREVLSSRRYGTSDDPAPAGMTRTAVETALAPHRSRVLRWRGGAGREALLEELRRR